MLRFKGESGLSRNWRWTMGSLLPLQVCWPPLVATLAQPQLSSSLSLQSHSGNFLKECFPDPAAFAPALGTHCLGSIWNRWCSGKRSCPGYSVHLRVQAKLASAAWKGLIRSITELLFPPPSSLGAFFLPSLVTAFLYDSWWCQFCV